LFVLLLVFLWLFCVLGLVVVLFWGASLIMGSDLIEVMWWCFLVVVIGS
jgi:hypothetical protein